jgi:hypothetical protein
VATVQPLKVLKVAPLNVRGAILVQVAPTNGGNPGTVDLEAVFVEIFPSVAHGVVATPIYSTLTSFNGLRG